MERVKRLAGNKIEIGMRIPTIESRESNIPKDKGNDIRDYMNTWHSGSMMFAVYPLQRRQEIVVSTAPGILQLRLHLKGLPRQVCTGFPPWPWSLALCSLEAERVM